MPGRLVPGGEKGKGLVVDIRHLPGNAHGKIIPQEKVKFLLMEPFYSRQPGDWLASNADEARKKIQSSGLPGDQISKLLEPKR